MIVAGAIVPHAPLLAGAIAGSNAEAVAPIRAALGGLAFAHADALVLLSPHGASTGVYERVAGNIAAFGVPEGGTIAEVDANLARALATAWGEPVIAGEADHGIVVALEQLSNRVPVVAATLEDGMEASSAIARGRALARVVAETDARVAFVASAHTGAALTPRAPLGLREEARDADRRLIEGLSDGREDLDQALLDVAHIGGSCGVGPVAAFAELFPAAARVHYYGAPFGVGYLVASARL